MGIRQRHGRTATAVLTPRPISLRERAERRQGRKPVLRRAPALPTALLHFAAHGATAEQGFAAVIVPFAAGAEAPAVSVEVAEGRPDGSVTLRAIAGGRQRVLTTGAFAG